MIPVPEVDGANDVVAWFGAWPRFHDHYLLRAPESGCANGELKIHGWVTNWNAVDAAGYFLQDRHCVVTLELARIESIELTERTFPAIIADLTLERDDAGWTISWESSYGAEGTIRAQGVRATVRPGAPTAT
jgi:hypothetical protein